MPKGSETAARDPASPEQAHPPATLVMEDVHLTYRVYADRRPSVRDLLPGAGGLGRHIEVHAVRGVSLTAYAGESIGVIGRNGSGKSTLLLAMAGLLPASSGRVLARTEPVLLGVGAVLNGNLSGRRNIVLGGLALGLTRKQVEERVEEVIDFAGVRESIDLPMRTYSSGMRARLQFAISTSVLPEVLLVDETLAVGDQDFRSRCDERLSRLRANAGTVVLVSHSMELIRQMCTRAVLMQAGRVVAEGYPAEVIRQYEKRATPVPGAASGS